MMTSAKGRRVGHLATAVLVCMVALAASATPAGATPSIDGCARTTLVGPSTSGPTGADPCPGIRPGAWIESSVGRCTINFIFSDRSQLFAGTAGHCVKKVGEIVSSVSLGERIGRVAYRVHHDFSRDFALIQIDRRLRDDVDPEACAWGGPTGIAAGSPAGYSQVHHMGYGYGTGYIPVSDDPQTITYARTGIAPRLDDPREMHFLGVVSAGDSGSGAYLTDGKALGVITVLEVSASSDEGVRGIVGGGRLDHLMIMAERAMGRPLFLVTADGTLKRPAQAEVASERTGS